MGQDQLPREKSSYGFHIKNENINTVKEIEKPIKTHSCAENPSAETRKIENIQAV